MRESKQQRHLTQEQARLFVRLARSADSIGVIPRMRLGNNIEVWLNTKDENGYKFKGWVYVDHRPLRPNPKFVEPIVVPRGLENYQTLETFAEAYDVQDALLDWPQLPKE